MQRDNVFWVPKDARWSHLQANAKQTTIGKLIDDATLAIEAKNASLKSVLPKDYNRPRQLKTNLKSNLHRSRTAKLKYRRQPIRRIARTHHQILHGPCLPK